MVVFMYGNVILMVVLILPVDAAVAERQFMLGSSYTAVAVQ